VYPRSIVRQLRANVEGVTRSLIGRTTVTSIGEPGTVTHHGRVNILRSTPAATNFIRSNTETGIALRRIEPTERK